MKRLIIILFFLFATSVAYSQTVTTDLQSSLDSGDIELILIRGKGGSSGFSLDGRIINTSSFTKKIRTHFDRPMYLRNRSSNSRQNMLATQVYRSDRSYFSDGVTSFIELKPNEQADVRFIAYCADFEKENPIGTDSFEIAEIPPHIADIGINITQYEANNSGEDIIVAAQVALWLAQGESPNEIRERFPFSQEDERLARYLINK